MMTRKKRDEWCAALRSGKYKQGKKRLRRKNHDGPDTFCCLGVYCDINDPSKWNYDENDREYYYEGKIGTLPVSLWDYTKSSTIEFFEWNDSLGKTFPEIADLIEQNIPIVDIDTSLKGNE